MMNATEAQIAIDRIVREFEKKFNEVWEWQPESGVPPHRCPKHNLPYIVFYNGLSKEEGESIPHGGNSFSYEDAVSDFVANMNKWLTGPTNSLFWRRRPCVQDNERKGRAWRCHVYARCVWV